MTSRTTLARRVVLGCIGVQLVCIAAAAVVAWCNPASDTVGLVVGNAVGLCGLLLLAELSERRES